MPNVLRQAGDHRSAASRSNGTGVEQLDGLEVSCGLDGDLDASTASREEAGSDELGGHLRAHLAKHGQVGIV